MVMWSMGQNYQKQCKDMQSPPLTQQFHSCLEDRQIPTLTFPKHGSLTMKLMYSLLDQVCCKAEIAMALPPLWTRWLKQKSQWSLEAMNGGTLDVNRTANQWDLAIRYYSMPKNCNPCYERGHCSFFLSLTLGQGWSKV